MNTSKIVGAILIIFSFGLGFMGFNKVNDSSHEVKVLGVELKASDESGKQQGYIFLGLAVVLFAGGIFTLNKGKE